MNGQIPRMQMGSVDTGMTWGRPDQPSVAILDGVEVLRRTVDGSFHIEGGDTNINRLGAYQLREVIEKLWTILVAGIPLG